MKTVSVPENLLPILINSMISKEGSISLDTIRAIVSESGMDIIAPKELLILNTILVVQGKMPELDPEMVTPRESDGVIYEFEKYYAIPQIIVARIRGEEVFYNYTLEEWVALKPIKQ